MRKKTTQALATYVNIGTIKHLIIKIFPKIVKFLFVHKSNKLLIFSILFSQFKFSHSSLSCPKYRLVSNQFSNWKVIPCKCFAKLGKEWLEFSKNLDNITVNKYAKQIPEFYGVVLRSFFCFNYIYPFFWNCFFS
jgi:hypothetical protein